MKANPLACTLLVLLAVAVQLLAQQPVSSSVKHTLPDFATLQPVTNAEKFLNAPDGTNAPAKQSKPASSEWQPPKGDEIIKGTEIPRWDDTTSLSKKTPKPIVLPDEITTRNGRVYRGVKLVAKNDFEITISCFDQDDAWQMENIKLVDLPDKLQNKLGYDPKKAAAEEARQKEREKLFAAPKPTPSERRWMEYNSEIIRMEAQQEEAAAAALLAKQKHEEELKEREIAAKEAAAAAAMTAAQNPPVVNVYVEQPRH